MGQVVLQDGLSIEDLDDPPGTPWIGYINAVLATNISSDTEDDGFPVSNLANPATHLFWRGGILTSQDETISVLLPTEDTCNYIAVAKHNFGTEGIAVSVDGRAGTDSPDTYTILIDTFVPEDDGPLIMRFTSQSLAEIRLHLQGGDVNPPQAAVLYVGELLILERGLDTQVKHVPLILGRRSTIYSGMSESGNFLGRVMLKEFRESTAVFTNFTPEWYRENFDPFIDASRTTPFFFAWHPATYPEDTGFAWLTNDPEPEVDSATERMSFELQMRGIA